MWFVDIKGASMDCGRFLASDSGPCLWMFSLTDVYDFLDRERTERSGIWKGFVTEKDC